MKSNTLEIQKESRTERNSGPGRIILRVAIIYIMSCLFNGFPRGKAIYSCH